MIQIIAGESTDPCLTQDQALCLAEIDYILPKLQFSRKLIKLKN